MMTTMMILKIMMTNFMTQAVPCALMVDLAASVGKLPGYKILPSLSSQSLPGHAMLAFQNITLCIKFTIIVRQNEELGLSLLFLDGKAGFNVLHQHEY